MEAWLAQKPANHGRYASQQTDDVELRAAATRGGSGSSANAPVPSPAASIALLLKAQRCTVDLDQLTYRGAASEARRALPGVHAVQRW
jgi:hypothetical protein